MLEEKDMQEAVERGANQVKKSGVDWLKYVETHPVQSVFFGLIGYFAIKGLIKRD